MVQKKIQFRRHNFKSSSSGFEERVGIINFLSSPVIEIGD